MKIIVDCFGGDNCPDAAVKGAVLAINEEKDLSVALCGDKQKISSILDTLTFDNSRVEIIEASDVISNSDKPVEAIRNKTDSSMVVALNALSEGKYDGLVSSGNTGALLTGATLLVGRIRGVARATLAPLIPTLVNGKCTILCDAGANVDCKASMLKEFAIMGNVYAKSAFGIENPSIGLLNNGAEEEKGNLLTKEAYQILKESGLNFVGNIEAQDFVSGKVDVIVADGFDGNVAIKATEGAAKAIMTVLKQGIVNGGIKAKIGYLLLKPVLKYVKGFLSTDTVGGAVFLGVKKVVVKAHGSSGEVPFKTTILQANKLAKQDVIKLIEDGIKSGSKDSK